MTEKSNYKLIFENASVSETCQGWKEERYCEISLFNSYMHTERLIRVLIIELIEIILEPDKSLATNDLQGRAPRPRGGWPAAIHFQALT